MSDVPHNQRLVVGKPYPDILGQEGAYYKYDGRNHELLLSASDPTRADIAAVKDGTAEFALVVEGPLLVLCSRFGELPWMESPYNWYLNPPAIGAEPLSTDLVGPNEGILLPVVLANRRTQRVMVLRALGLDHDFSLALLDAIGAQARAGFDSRAYRSALTGWYEPRPTNDLATRAVARCHKPARQGNGEGA